MITLTHRGYLDDFTNPHHTWLPLSPATLTLVYPAVVRFITDDAAVELRPSSNNKYIS